MRLAAQLLLVVALLQQPAAQTQVQVHLVDGLNGQPVSRARYAVTGAGLVDAITGNGDPLGNVELSDLAPGRYQLTIDKAGYFQEKFNFALNSGSVDLPTIMMTTKREISGVVRWQDGELAANANVRAIPLRGGKPLIGNFVGGSNANARGEFTIQGLRPGRYILVVNPPAQRGDIDASGRFVVGGPPRIALPVYYPGVSVPDVGAAIDLRGTETVQNINILLEEKPGTIVEGTVGPSVVAPLGSDVGITLNYGGIASYSTSARVGDTFRIGPVPAGFYGLDVQNRGEQRGRAWLALTIGGDILRNVAISIPSPVVLNGRVEIDDPTQASAVPIRIRSERIPGALTVLANTSGEFRIPQVVAGENYGMDIDLSRVPNVYLAEVSQGEPIQTASPFPVRVGTDPIRIVLKSDGGTISGVAKDNGHIVPKAFVVLAPKDRKLEQHFRVVTAGDDGTYKLSGIAPGDYDLFAFDRNEDDDYLDDMFLNRYSERAVEVKAALRSVRSIEVAVQTLPRR